MNMCGVAWNIL